MKTIFVQEVTTILILLGALFSAQAQAGAKIVSLPTATAQQWLLGSWLSCDLEDSNLGFFQMEPTRPTTQLELLGDGTYQISKYSWVDDQIGSGQKLDHGNFEVTQAVVGVKHLALYAFLTFSSDSGRKFDVSLQLYKRKYTGHGSAFIINGLTPFTTYCK